MEDDTRITPDVTTELEVQDIDIEQLEDASAAGWCVGSAGTFGCPSSAGSYGTVSSH